MNGNLKKLLCMVTLWSVLGIHPAATAEVWLSGFGSASVSCFSSDDAEYASNLQTRGPGRSSTCDAGLDSTLGMQLDWELGPLEFGLQGIMERNGHGDFTPALNTAQLRWHASDQTTLRVGRSPTPLFLHSETRQVRFTMPWVRPPVHVYGILPLFNYDGVEAIYRSRLGGWNSEWQVGGGSVNLDQETPSAGGDLTLDSSQVFTNFLLERNELQIKLGYMYMDLTVEEPAIDQILTALRSFGPGSSQASLAEDLAINESAGHAVALGFSYTPRDWFMISEFAFTTIEGSRRDQFGAYLTVGRTMQRWSVFTTLAARYSSTDQDASRAGVLAPLAQALLDSSRFDNSALSVGTCYALTTQTKLKAQLDWIRPHDNSFGPYVNHSANYNFSNPDDDVLMSLSLDFLF